MPEQLNPELQEALQEAGADAKSSRVAARSVAGATDMAKCLIWLKAVMMVGGVLVALNFAMLGRLFVMSDRVSENTSAIAAHSVRLDEMNRRVGNLEEGQEHLRREIGGLRESVAELRRGQEEIVSLLRTRLSKNIPGEFNGGAPEVSAAPVVAVPVSPPSPPSPNPPNQ